MRLYVTLAVVLYTLGTSMAWALDDTPTLAPRYMPRPEDGRALNRGPSGQPVNSLSTAAGRSLTGEGEAAVAPVRPQPLRPQPLPLTRVLPAEGHGAPLKLPAKPL